MQRPKGGSELSRRGFLRAATAATGLVAACATELPSALAVVRSAEGRSRWSSFGPERAFVGDELTLQASLGDAGGGDFRVEGPGGWHTELRGTLGSDGLTRCVWRIPLEAVPPRPGLHRLWLLARSGAQRRWVRSAQPLDVVINPCAFGL